MVDLQVKYNCKVLPFGTIASVAIALNISMGVMFVTIYMGLPAIVSTVLLVGLLFLIIMFLSSEATFTIRENSLERLLLSSGFLFKNKPEKRYSWNDVKGYKNGTDRGKYRGEFQYLEIKFRNGDEWKITDMYGERKEGFENFVRYFLAQVNKHNEQTHRTEPPLSTANVNTPKQMEIKREKTFYESIFGKVFTIALGVFIALLLVYGKSYMNGSATFKLNFVLIPGFAYLFYRTFISKKK